MGERDVYGEDFSFGEKGGNETEKGQLGKCGQHSWKKRHQCYISGNIDGIEIMPVVKHRPHFSELIVKAAEHVIKQKSRAAKYANAVEACAKRRASSQYKPDIQHGRNSTIRIHSREVSGILVISSIARQLLESPFIRVIRSCFIIAAFVTLSAQTSQASVHRYGNAITISNITIDIYFLLEGVVKVFVLFSTVVIKKDIGASLNYGDLFAESGMVEITVACISLTAGECKMSLWFRLVRLLFISTTGVRHSPQIDVLLVSSTAVPLILK